MASTIVSTTIDANYPVAGIDNDTQGFRDNFQIIKDGLTTAASEITALQNNTVKLNESNDLNGTNISDANFILNTEQYHNIGNVTSNINISFLNGHYQVLTVDPEGSSITFTLADWPDRDGLAKMTVQLSTNLSGDAEDKTITWQSEGGAPIYANADFPSPFVLNTATYDVDTGGPAIVEFWSYKQGGTRKVFAKWLGLFSEI